jgi:hypothetical protein
MTNLWQIEVVIYHDNTIYSTMSILRFPSDTSKK